MNDKIRELRKANNKWKDNMTEEQVKIYIVLPFLKLYGYDTENLLFEKKIEKGFCDIWVPVGRNESLLVEVKSGGHTLISDDIAQVHHYAVSRGQEYAILTNGYEYVLLNFSKIIPVPRTTGESAMMAYAVFWFDIFHAKGKNVSELCYMEYLSYENIYNKHVTMYFCDIAQYKELKMKEGLKPNSWMVYRSTLFNFYDFFAKKHGRYGYERLMLEDFEEFIVTCKRNGTGTSISTIENNYTHIYDMLYTLRNSGRNIAINLQAERYKGVGNFDVTEKKKTFTPISENEIMTALEFYSKRKNSLRNCSLFLIVASLGMERSQIIDLKWSDFDDKLENIYRDMRKIKICPLLATYLKTLRAEKEKNKIKSDYVFLSFYRKEYKQMNDSGINDVFDELVELGSDVDWKAYSPKYIRNRLIVTMFDAGYAIEDIIFITGIDLTNLSKYITMDMIYNRARNTGNWKKLYNGLLCSEECITLK